MEKSSAVLPFAVTSRQGREGQRTLVFNFKDPFAVSSPATSPYGCLSLLSPPFLPPASHFPLGNVKVQNAET